MAAKPLNIVVRFLNRLVGIRSTRKGLRNRKGKLDDGAYIPGPPEHVVINPVLRGQEFAETLHHELMHAASDIFDEDFVLKFSHQFIDIFYRDDILARAGLRRTDG